MGIEELLSPQREKILQIATKHGAYNVRVFGSVARRATPRRRKDGAYKRRTPVPATAPPQGNARGGEATENSDIDFLVEIEPQRTLFDYIALIQDLTRLL